MFKYKSEWYDMSNHNMWSAIVDHYNDELYIWGGEYKVLKGDKMKIGEAYVIDKKHGVINLATTQLSWVIEEAMNCEVERDEE